MPKKHTFKATILDAGGGGAFVEVPFDVEAVFGAKRPKVKAMIEGVPYRGILSRMGGPNHILVILKDIRAKIGKSFGDEVKITVELDTEPRVVEVPKDLIKELKKHKEAKAFFDKLSYTHQREYVMWINEAKKEETRARRIAQTVEHLKPKRT
ncbi:MAG: antitermination protein NusB [Anaerolineae bacterium]|nr:MAG: antitermination protein NusB [Anaerolineae bacterium]WKZ44111.1 MAG: YdeI/OmpD-associated family protein [Anaerolineales bacterium]